MRLRRRRPAAICAFSLRFVPLSNEWSTEETDSSLCNRKKIYIPKSPSESRDDGYIQVAILKGCWDTHSCTDSFYLVRFTFQKSKLDWIWSHISLAFFHLTLVYKAKRTDQFTKKKYNKIQENKLCFGSKLAQKELPQNLMFPNWNFDPCVILCAAFFHSQRAEKNSTEFID